MNYLLGICSREEAALFRNSRDYDDFLRMLLKARDRFKVSIFAFCLMPEYAKFIVHSEFINVSSDFLLCLAKDYATRNIIKKREIKNKFPLKASQGCLKNDWQLFHEIKKIEFEPVQAGFVLLPAHYRYSSAFYRIRNDFPMVNEHAPSGSELSFCHGLN